MGIKKWLHNKLGITDLINENTRLTQLVDQNAVDLMDIESSLMAEVDSMRYEMISYNKSTREKCDTLYQIIDSGFDIDPRQYSHGGSWAVICIEGKQDFVRFYDLSKKEGAEMMHLLKMFEKSNRVVDAPPRFLGNL
jgi:hypothetical protein